MTAPVLRPGETPTSRLLEVSKERLAQATSDRLHQERLRDREKTVSEQISRVQQRNDLENVFRTIFGGSGSA